MSELQEVVSIRRNSLYDDPVLRAKANAEILADALAWHQYNERGIAEYVPGDNWLAQRFPCLREVKGQYYCSELLNHYCIEHSDGKMNLSGQHNENDDVSPYGIQTVGGLVDIPTHSDALFLRECDYVMVNGHSIPAWLIRLRTAGLWHAWDYKVSSHAGILVRQQDGTLWIAEMLPDGGPTLSSTNKYTRM